MVLPDCISEEYDETDSGCESYSRTMLLNYSFKHFQKLNNGLALKSSKFQPRKSKPFSNLIARREYHKAFCIKNEFFSNTSKNYKSVESKRPMSGQYDRNGYSKLIESVGDVRDIWDGLLNTKQKAIFFYHVIIRSIQSCQNKDYIVFDAHTTSNCCHGMSLLACDLITVVLSQNLNELVKLIVKKIEELEKDEILDFSSTTKLIGNELLALGSLYVLAYTRSINEKKRMRTEARKLQSIYLIGVSFCWELVNSLKVHFSNIVANSYGLYLKGIAPGYELNGVGAAIWGKYVENDHIRIDKRGIKYVSCIYSTQVSIAHLISSRSKVVMVNDIINFSGEFVDRLIWIFQGDGVSKLKILTEEEVCQSVKSNGHEPIVVFSGYMCSDSIDVSTLNNRMSVWREQFPCLMIACDVNYPQFPQVSDDPNFNSDPIIPTELSAKRLFASHAKVLGVSQADPSLFCSSHTYTSSFEQIHRALFQKDMNALPSCFHSLQSSHSDPWGAALSYFL
jgi:hypothetical protein